MLKYKKNTFIILSLALAIMFSVVSINAMVSGNISVIKPTDSSIYSQNMTFSIYLQSGYEDENYTTANFYGYSSSTANNTYVLLTSGVNDTAVSFNITFNTTYLEDSNDYSVKVQLFNGSDYVNQTMTGSITVDNTVPVAPSTLIPTDLLTTSSTGITFTGVVNDAKTTGCTLLFSGTNPGASSYAMTYSGTNCSYTFSDIPETSYTWYIRDSDGTNTTDSSTSTLNIHVQSDGGSGDVVGNPTDYDEQTCLSLGSNYIWQDGICYQIITNQEEGSNEWIYLIIGLIIVIGIVAWIVNANKK